MEAGIGGASAWDDKVPGSTGHPDDPGDHGWMGHQRWPFRDMGSAKKAWAPVGSQSPNLCLISHAPGKQGQGGGRPPPGREEAAFLWREQSNYLSVHPALPASAFRSNLRNYRLVVTDPASPVGCLLSVFPPRRYPEWEAGHSTEAIS